MPAICLGPRFARFLAARSVSSLGSGLHLLAFPLLASTMTSDPRIIAGLTLASSLPSLLLALPVGAWVDRSHRGRLMAGSDLCCFAILAVMSGLYLAGLLVLWQLFVLAAILGVAELVFGTSSFAIVPSLVDKRDLVRANGYLATTSELGGGVIGPALGGVAYSVTPVLPFVVNAVSYLLSSLFIGSFAWRGDTRAVRTDAATDRRHELLAGIAFLRSDQACRALLLLSTCSALFGMMPEGTLVLFARENLQLSGPGFGLLLAATSVGAVLGGLSVSAFSKHFAIGPLMVVTNLSYGLLLIPPAFLSSGLAVGLVFFVQGIPLIVHNSAFSSLLQQLMPGDLLGRYSAIGRVVNAVVVPLSLAAGGFLGHWLGLRAVWFIAGIGFALSMLLNVRGIRAVNRAVN